jgi:hypothetical protein
MLRGEAPLVYFLAGFLAADGRSASIALLMNRAHLGGLIAAGAFTVVGVMLTVTPRSRALAAAKFKARRGTEIRPRFRKDRIAHVGKARAWQDADWKWIRKNVPADKLRIEVVAWPREHEGSDRALTQEFTADSEAAARSYAKTLVEDGTALLTNVNKQVWLHAWSPRDPEGWYSAEYESYERER